MSEQKIYVARFILEAETPLFIGSGKASLLKDALVQRDANGFPMIPGTSLAGVLRHAVAEKNEVLASKLFGSGKKSKNHGQKKNEDHGKEEDPGQGSPVKVSQGFLLLEGNKVSEGLFLDDHYSKLYEVFQQLPVRQHVALDDKGTAKKGQLYDHEVIYKGVQFVFELEAPSRLISKNDWAKLLEKIKSDSFRLGAGTRNGYGLLKAKKSFEKELSIEEYLELSPSFNSPKWWSEANPVKNHFVDGNIVNYTLELKPDPFFIFGSGLSDEDVDQTPVREKVATYDQGPLKLSESGHTLVPGSSVKGAIAHRVAYYYNKSVDRTAEKGIEQIRDLENEAVSALFGKAEVSNPMAGNVFFKDVFIKPEQINNDEVLNHVAIDRFTGGAMDGMLFSEKVSHFKDQEEILVLEVQLKLTSESEKYQAHLIDALKDICRGLLPLGGMATKGHGIFTGSLKEGSKEIFKYTP